MLDNFYAIGVGENDFGQIDIPEEINSNIIQVSAGGFHSLFITKQGYVRGVGLNSNFQNSIY